MLSVVVLSFNRKDALARTLRELETLLHVAGGGAGGGEIIVVDNASTDGTPAAIRAQFPRVKLIALTENVGVAGFNRGAEKARGDTLLILDDDAWPTASAVRGATALLARDEDIGAVSLLPRHPASGKAEWPHATTAQDRWPFMGCGLVVRAEAWKRVRGYEESFFLYRNDTDLSLKLLAAGYDVRFEPAWVVWHDSVAADRKPLRWLRIATRNWAWMTRRHGRGVWALAGLFVGFSWALRLAGFHPTRLAAVARGMIDGLFSTTPPLPPGVNPDGSAFERLIKLRLSPRRLATASQSAAATIASSVRHSA